MLTVNENCIGCGICESMCPDIFLLKDMQATIQSTNFNLEEIQEVIEQCPVNAVSL